MPFFLQKSLFSLYKPRIINDRHFRVIGFFPINRLHIWVLFRISYIATQTMFTKYSSCHCRHFGPPKPSFSLSLVFLMHKYTHIQWFFLERDGFLKYKIEYRHSILVYTHWVSFFFGAQHITAFLYTVKLHRKAHHHMEHNNNHRI